jgi:asparagine synthase (glutamine-hydrolysing)
MTHFQWYSTEVIYYDKTIIIGKSLYDGYPFTFFQGKRDITIVEGAIYNKSDDEVQKRLQEISLSELIPDELSEKIEEFLLDNHGEFVVTKYDKQNGNCLVFNDALGRLPFYYCSNSLSSSQRIVMSREMKFIIPFLEKRYLSKIALCEYLLFGYSLGDRTFWEEIKRLPPASMLLINAGNEQFSFKKTFHWNLDPKENCGTANDLNRETEKSIRLFLSSLKDVTQKLSKDYAQTMSLSGGLDSRAVLAGLLKIGLSPTAYSFPSKENQIARTTAQSLKVNFEIVSSSFAIKDEDYVRLTDGLIDLGLRSRISYLHGIREKTADKTVLYTGDGGDKTLGPLGFRSNVTSIDELLKYIIKTDHIFTPDEISSILNVQKNTVKKHLLNHLAKYPERTMEGKFAHFKVFERGFKWLFVGEDRNRIFLWSTTPFYSVNFFRSLMSISQNAKKHYAFYKDFLGILNPALNRIRYYDRAVSLSIPKPLLMLYLTVFEWVKTHFYVQGSSSLINFLFREQSSEGLDKLRNLTLHILGQRSIFEFPNSSRFVETLKQEKNPMKLNVLATLALYINLEKPSGFSPVS